MSLRDDLLAEHKTVTTELAKVSLAAARAALEGDLTEYRTLSKRTAELSFRATWLHTQAIHPSTWGR